ncbi:hypothetical protein [Paenibacillus sp. 481]|uniref:hypothetical protein n=1 Tax=Paenibacillus sp. 481 TaxID=2835869 RepID=UPI001E5A5F62|nr:hypothetical protein [Paenibacillus sp. 481]UHA71943.1 hypothetical protein KIK04_14515 [Paenibacillus sp. 481]
MFSVQEVLRMFPDVIDKEGSRMAVLAEVMTRQFNDLAMTIQRIELWRSIDKAEGKALDMIGHNLGQQRGQATDEVYRILLRSKMARMNASGDLNSIIHVLSLALNAAPNDFAIEEKQADPHSPEPAAISVVQVPYDKLNSVGMSPSQFVRLVQSVVAAGVRVAQVDLSGTFALSKVYDTLEQGQHGLADEAMTTGGTLGDMYTPGQDYQIPI